MEKPEPKTQKVSSSTVRRLSKYYRTLSHLLEEGRESVASEELARLEGFTSAQVRKDLSCFGTFGKRGLGYSTSDLKKKIAAILGLDRSWNVAIIGAGNIGTALVDYAEFRVHGFHLKLLFDIDSGKIGKKVKSLIVRNMADLESEFEKEKIEIVILAVPADAAQSAADRVVKAGVKAILNFAPRNLNVPPDVTVRQENTAMELETLSYAINQQRKNG